MFAPSVTRVSLTCVIRRAFIEIFSMKNRKGYANEPVATFRGSLSLSLSLSLLINQSADERESILIVSLESLIASTSDTVQCTYFFAITRAL